MPIGITIEAQNHSQKQEALKLPEEELTIKVGDFNPIHIDYIKVPKPS